MPNTLSLKDKGKKDCTILLGEQPSPPQISAMILLTWLLLLFRVVLRPLNWSHGKQTGFKPVLLSSASDLPCGSQLAWTWAGSGGMTSAAAEVTAMPVTNRLWERERMWVGRCCIKNILKSTNRGWWVRKLFHCHSTSAPSCNKKTCLPLFLVSWCRSPGRCFVRDYQNSSWAAQGPAYSGFHHLQQVVINPQHP